VSSTESKYAENAAFAARRRLDPSLGRGRTTNPVPANSQEEAAWLRVLKEELPRFIPYLTTKCGVEFRGRILEIGAGDAWLSAELSKLPNVVEIITTDLSPELLKEQAPKAFRVLQAHGAKITRMPGDFHQLDFPNNYFDFVVASAVLHDARNIVQVLREAKRVLKPGGQFVAVREPVWPLVKIKSRTRMLEKLLATGINERFYALADYREFFKQAVLPLEVKRVNTSSGFKYYVNAVVNGLTHARYAFIGTKRLSPAASPARRTPPPRRAVVG
jgi:ubiquinone/menaquinone biosynthesis C-methylase UbiE